MKKILRGNNLEQALSSTYHLKTDKGAILFFFFFSKCNLIRYTLTVEKSNVSS